MGQLQAGELEVVHDSNDTDARTVVINTCGFIHDAKEESIHTILQFIQAKEAGEIDNVFVMGCLSERYKKDLEEEIGEPSRLLLRVVQIEKLKDKVLVVLVILVHTLILMKREKDMRL